MPQLTYKAAILPQVRRAVIKVGSAVLSANDGLRTDVIGRLAAEADSLVRGGREVVIVSSGAIAAGRAKLAGPRRGFGPFAKSTMAARQAAAATGQIELMAQWAAAFRIHGRTVAQILLTHQDLAERKRRNHAVQTIRTLLAAEVTPIINENDTVAVDEIRLGDNDVLSSLVASMLGAQLLVILSDVAGVLTGDPRKRADAQLIPLIPDPGLEMSGLVADGAGPLGSGGMAAKLRAARQAARAGIAVMICSGREPGALAGVFDPDAERGTLILPATSRLKSRKHWIAFALRPAGALRLDRGAGEALRVQGSSLLASGVRDVVGDFSSGDCVSLLDCEGVEFGRGLVNYPAADVLKLRGRQSNEIASVLGYKVADEIIHRDNFVLMQDVK